MSEFGSVNLEEMAGEDQRLSDSGQNFLDQFVPMPDVKPGQTGSVIVRILPPVKGGKLFQYNRVHQMNGRKIHCPRPLVNGKWDRKVPCPICEYYSSLWKNADKLDDAGRKDDADKLKTEARSLKPIERYYYNAIVRMLLIDGEKQENIGPRILSIGKTLHKMIIRAIVGDESEPALGDVTSIKNGFDFVIKKEVVGTGDSAYPRYEQSKFARESSALGTPEAIKEWVEGLNDLTTLRNVKEMDVLEKELAIHRCLIPDETEGFDTEAFDAKFKPADEQVAELMDEASSTATSVSMPETNNESGVVAETNTKEPEAPVHDDFLKELEEYEG